MLSTLWDFDQLYQIGLYDLNSWEPPLSFVFLNGKIKQLEKYKSWLEPEDTDESPQSYWLSQGSIHHQ